MQIASVTWLKHFLTLRFWPDHWKLGDYYQKSLRKLVLGQGFSEIILVHFGRISMTAAHLGQHWKSSSDTISRVTPGKPLAEFFWEDTKIATTFLLSLHFLSLRKCYLEQWPEILSSVHKLPRERGPHASFTRLIFCWPWWPFGSPQQLWMQKTPFQQFWKKFPTKNLCKSQTL